jgi:hypothetical protein
MLAIIRIHFGSFAPILNFAIYSHRFKTIRIILNGFKLVLFSLSKPVSCLFT